MIFSLNLLGEYDKKKFKKIIDQVCDFLESILKKTLKYTPNDRQKTETKTRTNVINSSNIALLFLFLRSDSDPDNESRSSRTNGGDHAKYHNSNVVSIANGIGDQRPHEPETEDLRLLWNNQTFQSSISIRSYLERILKYANCSHSCYIVAYIYLDRFIKKQPFLLFNSLSIHRFIITSVLVSAKFIDDL